MNAEGRASRAPSDAKSGVAGDLRGSACPRRTRAASGRVAAALLTLGLLLGGCFSETYQRGYIVPDGALEQIPLGSTQEQVLIVLGTPSTVATVSGEAFYYISQRAERAIGFMPQEVVDQRVIAVYFDKNRRVERLANYGLKDGRVFDFISRTTPTGGKDFAYINAMFKIF
jgi:outer membrane protein assembly factor BamE (lipoprotein component of BamABCDE complex)